MAHCLLNQTGALRHERWAKRLNVHLYADQRQITPSVRRKRVTGWVQVTTRAVLQGR